MIKFDSEKQTFILNTKDTCYAFKIAYGRYLIHLYYGERGGSIDFGYMPPKVSFMTAPKGMEDGNFSLETIGAEYAYYGTGDFRTSSVSVRTPCGDGNVLFFTKAIVYLTDAFLSALCRAQERAQAYRRWKSFYSTQYVVAVFICIIPFTRGKILSLVP